MSEKITHYYKWRKEVARFFHPYLRPDHTKLYLLGGLGLIMTVARTLLIWKFGEAISQISGGEFDHLHETLLFIAGLVLFNQLLGIYSSLVRQRLSLCFVDRLRGKVYEHVMKVSFPILQHYKKGDLLTHMSGDVDRILAYVINMPLSLFQSTTVFVIYSGVLLWIDWQMSLIALTMAPLFFLSQRYVAPKTGAISKSFTKERIELFSIEEQSLSNLRGISAFNSEQYMRDIHRTQFDTARQWALKARRINILNGAFYTVLMYVAGVVVIYSGISSIEAGHLTIGALVSFLIYIRNITGPMGTLAGLPVAIQANRIAAERLMELLQMQPATTDIDNAQALQVQNGDIAFNEVSFSYPKQSQTVFSHLNLHIHPGETVALVGPSGVGKSTFAGLLLRFYDPQQGTICIDGVDIRSVTLKSLRNQISMVWQEPFLTNGSIRQNLLLANPDATDERIIAACQSSFAWEFVEALEQGLDTVIGAHGVDLSVGQRQRLAIAQAFLRDTPILILDEASSALDSRSEQMVVDAVSALRKQRTTVLIAHRFSSIRSADRIIYIDKQGTLTVGSHQELLSQHKGYKAAVEWQTSQQSPNKQSQPENDAG